MQKKFIDFILKFKKRTVLIVGEYDINLLYAFFNGYFICEDIYGIKNDFNFKFLKYVEKELNVKANSSNWATLIKDKSNNGEEEFELFYKLFENYLESI